MTSLVVLPKGPEAPLLLLDGGYLLFYRISATESWLRNQPEDKRPANEAEHLQLLSQHLKSQLDKLTKKFKVAPGNVLTMFDCPSAENWRNRLWPDYKGTRGDATPVIRAFYEVLRETMPAYGPVLRLAELEADDLVALTVRRIRALRPQQPVYIFANDRDYLQLHRYPAVHLVEGAGKEIPCAPEGGEFELWKKILMGDKSDNIPPVARGIGIKTAEKLARDPEARAKIEVKHPDTLLRNRSLVDFDAIPDELVARFDAARTYALDA